MLTLIEAFENQHIVKPFQPLLLSNKLLITSYFMQSINEVLIATSITFRFVRFG